VGDTTHVSEQHRAVVRGASVVFGAVAALLLPWTIVLNLALGSRAVVRNWDVAWTGFDLGLAAVLGAVAYAARRRTRWLGRAATAGGTMLVCDAWFDVLTARDGRDIAFALAGLVVELPLAALCFFVAADGG
jgi:hypothetical protein